MKKLFINPEINSIELTPGNDIMASAELASTRKVVYNSFGDSDINAEYEMWKGVDAWLD